MILILEIILPHTKVYLKFPCSIQLGSWCHTTSTPADMVQTLWGFLMWSQKFGQAYSPVMTTGTLEVKLSWICECLNCCKVNIFVVQVQPPQNKTSFLEIKFFLVTSKSRGLSIIWPSSLPKRLHVVEISSAKPCCWKWDQNIKTAWDSICDL